MKSSSSGKRGQGIGCKRLFDYYFVVTCSDHGKQQTVRRVKSKSLAGAHDKDPVHAQFALRPKIVDHYPQKNYPDCALLPWVARASMPRGVRARTRPPPPKYFTFTGWNRDGHKLYGACLEVFEHIEIKNQKQPVYLPKTLGLLSHHPYFHAYEIFLKCLWHTIPKRIIPIEDLILHYFYDIPAPPVSKKLAYNLGSFKLYLGARNEFDIPIKELPIEVPFTQLSKDRMCTILKLLLLEKRVVFVCQFIPELTPVCELFSSLLFPLQWKHLFIPLVSKTVAEALREYEHPFLAGLPRFVFVRPEIHKNMPKDSYIVFLDRNEICDTNQQPIPVDTVPELPLSLEDNLQNAIHRLARILTMPYVSREITLQALRDMFAVITKLIFVTANPQLFEIDNDSGNDFCAEFRNTQLFSSFLNYYKRVNPKDAMAKDVYPFYKSNEALGKHFARRSHTISWSRGFDEKQYHEKDKFRVNKDVIEKGATMKKRPEPWPNGKRFVYAPEFDWTDAAKEFHKSHVSEAEKSKKKPYSRRTKSIKRKPRQGKHGSGSGGGVLEPINESNGKLLNGNGSAGGSENNGNDENSRRPSKNRAKKFREASMSFLNDIKTNPNLGDRCVRAREFEKWFKSDEDKKHFMNVLLEDPDSVNILMSMARELDPSEHEKIRRTFKVTRYVDHKLRKAAKLSRKELTSPNGNSSMMSIKSDTSKSLLPWSPRSEASQSDTNMLSDVDSAGNPVNDAEIIQKPSYYNNSNNDNNNGTNSKNNNGKNSNHKNSHKGKSPKNKSKNDSINSGTKDNDKSAFGTAVKNIKKTGTHMDVGDSPDSADGASPNFLSDMSSDDDDDANRRRKQKRQNTNKNSNNNNNNNNDNGNNNNSKDTAKTVNNDKNESVNDKKNNNNNNDRTNKSNGKDKRSDSDNDDESASASDTGTSSSGSGSETGSDASGSTFESDWGSDTTIEPNNDSSRRESVASVRQGEKFVHLNEFELRLKEKKLMAESQKRHNALLGNAESEAIVATDLFSRSVLAEWKQIQQLERKRSRKNVK